jgi:1,4-alpha-glucan branching enzyme
MKPHKDRGNKMMVASFEGSPESSLISREDLHLFNEGRHSRLYNKMGAHPQSDGTFFSVWAPNALRVSVIGDFNNWNTDSHPLKPREQSGIWEGFVRGVGKGALYKYHIESKYLGYTIDKTDPLGYYCEQSPRTASIVWDTEYTWGDHEWVDRRRSANALNAPISIYEVHLGSWMRIPEENNRPLTYRELAPKVADYVLKLGFTHVEFLPVMEHPFNGSWGYQITGFFAPSSRYGTPQDFMYLIDYLHQNGIGVFLDWVPSHFPNDSHGLGFFDGTHLYEHADPRLGQHPDWDSLIFNYGRKEVQSFLISNALYWLDKYHADGLRFDAVASMLYLDYSRKQNEWIPNRYGGRENLEAMDFLKNLNTEVYRNYPDVQTIAEESTSWPMVSRPTYVGGLGFGFKWDMGWMHDTLKYMSTDPIFRKHHHNDLTFRLLYAFSENFILPLSHDEVVHGKSSLLAKMPGADVFKFANLRLLLGYQFAQPGKKLLFMGGEFGQWHEWNHDLSLEWHLLKYPQHIGIQKWTSDLNRVYREEKALSELDFDPNGFEWVDFSDYDHSIVSFIRRSKSAKNTILVVCNFTPVKRFNYRIGVPFEGEWQEILNSDAAIYGGNDCGNKGKANAEAVPFHNQPFSLNLVVPPLGILFFKRQ